MNILRRHEGAKLLFMEYAGKDVYMQNYYTHAAYHGIRNTSIVQAAQTPWIDHLYVKTSVDIVLVLLSPPFIVIQYNYTVVLICVTIYYEKGHDSQKWTHYRLRWVRILAHFLVCSNHSFIRTNTHTYIHIYNQ